MRRPSFSGEPARLDFQRRPLWHRCAPALAHPKAVKLASPLSFASSGERTSPFAASRREALSRSEWQAPPTRMNVKQRRSPAARALA